MFTGIKSVNYQYTAVSTSKHLQHVVYILSLNIEIQNLCKYNITQTHRTREPETVCGHMTAPLLAQHIGDRHDIVKTIPSTVYSLHRYKNSTFKNAKINHHHQKHYRNVENTALIHFQQWKN